MKYNRLGIQNQEEAIAAARREGKKIVRSKLAPVVIAYKVLPTGRAIGQAWRGKAVNTAWHYSFSSVARLEAYATEYITRVGFSTAHSAERKKEKTARRLALRAADYWMVGDVIYNSWGYEQTNIDWYQVTEVKAKSIVIRKIKANSNDHGGPSGGMTAPRRNEFCGAPMLKPLNDEGRISAEHGCMSKWDGRPKACSSYY